MKESGLERVCTAEQIGDRVIISVKIAVYCEFSSCNTNAL